MGRQQKNRIVALAQRGTAIDGREELRNVLTLPYRWDVGILGDARAVLKDILEVLKSQSTKRSYKQGEYFKEIQALRRQWEEELEEQRNSDPMSIARVLKEVRHFLERDAIVVSSAGLPQELVHQQLPMYLPRTYISSGGYSTMGFGVPAAIGACLGAPGRIIVAIVGDGGFQMTIQELGTIAQENLPVKILLLNNNFLGMVRQWQQMFYEKRYSFVQLDNPDFIHVANGFRIPGKKITKREELKLGLKHLLKSQGPFLLEVVVGKEDNVFPMMPTGASVEEMRLE